MQAFFAKPGTVAVTGHRANRITAVAEAQLAQICAGLFKAAHRECALLSCLASGADTVAAETWPEAHELRTLLPVPVADWRSLIRPEMAVSRFDHLVNRAAPEILCHGAAPDYAALADALLDRSDRLFAIWDGATGRPGGTGSVVGKARARGMPVLHLRFIETDFVWEHA